MCETLLDWTYHQYSRKTYDERMTVLTLDSHLELAIDKYDGLSHVTHTATLHERIGDRYRPSVAASQLSVADSALEVSHDQHGCCKQEKQKARRFTHC